jgi:hypothetical protein
LSLFPTLQEICSGCCTVAAHKEKVGEQTPGRPSSRRP